MLGRSIILMVALAGCSLLPEGSISKDEAVAVALDRTELANAVPFSVVEGQWPLGLEPRRAWIVTFRGAYLECESVNDRRPSEVERCQLVDGHAILYVDLTTGEFLGGNVGGPIAMPEGR